MLSHHSCRDDGPHEALSVRTDELSHTQQFNSSSQCVCRAALFPPDSLHLTPSAHLPPISSSWQQFIRSDFPSYPDLFLHHCGASSVVLHLCYRITAPWIRCWPACSHRTNRSSSLNWRTWTGSNMLPWTLWFTCGAPVAMYQLITTVTGLLWLWKSLSSLGFPSKLHEFCTWCPTERSLTESKNIYYTIQIRYDSKELWGSRLSRLSPLQLPCIPWGGTPHGLNTSVL